MAESSRDPGRTDARQTDHRQSKSGRTVPPPIQTVGDVGTARVTPAQQSRFARRPAQQEDDEEEMVVQKRRTRKEKEMEEALVQTFVRKSLFPRLKFLTKKNQDDPDPLDYSEEVDSICQQCLLHCDMENDNQKHLFWMRAKHVVGAELKRRRNDVQSTMYNEWRGEFCCC